MVLGVGLPRRSFLAPVTLGLGVVALFLGCSSSSSLEGIGACEGFCNKWYGSHCKNGPKTHEECLGGDGIVNGCLDDQARCAVEENSLIRCATVDGSIACETGSGKPKILGCQKQQSALNACLLCDQFCERWTGTAKPSDAGPGPVPCKRAPTRPACLAGCLDPQCATEMQQYRSCATGAVTCDASGEPWDPGCRFYMDALVLCLGGTHPFDWPPPRATTAELR
jgi:hypothetical protein